MKSPIRVIVAQSVTVKPAMHQDLMFIPTKFVGDPKPYVGWVMDTKPVSIKTSRGTWKVTSLKVVVGQQAGGRVVAWLTATTDEGDTAEMRLIPDAAVRPGFTFEGWIKDTLRDFKRGHTPRKRWTAA